MKTPDEIVEFASAITDRPQLWLLLSELERRLDVRFCMVTRDDVEYEFGAANDGHRTMDMSEWEQFKKEWFWSKGWGDVMFEDVSTAIRFDLREAGLIPREAVVE